MRKEPRDYLKIQEDPNEEAGIRSTFCLQSRILSWRWSGRAFLILHVVVVLGKAAPSRYLSIYLMCCRPVGCTASHPPHSSRQGGREGFEAVQQWDFKPAHRQQHGRGCLTATLPKSRPTAPYLSLRISDHYHSFDHRIALLTSSCPGKQK